MCCRTLQTPVSWTSCYATRRRTRRSPSTAVTRLELDGRAHDYTAGEWKPAIYDIAASLLGAARPNREPPSLVEQAQDAVSWLSRAIIDLDRDARDVAAAIVDVLGRILALYVFADVARNAAAEHGE